MGKMKWRGVGVVVCDCDKKEMKLDDNGEQMILLGYHSTGGYKLFDPKSKQIIISRDVVFDESRSWD